MTLMSDFNGVMGLKTGFEREWEETAVGTFFKEQMNRVAGREVT